MNNSEKAGIGLPILEKKKEEKEPKKGALAPIIGAARTKEGGLLYRWLGLGPRSPVGQRAAMARRAGLKALLPGLVHFLFLEPRGLLGVAVLGGVAAFYALVGHRGISEPLAPFGDYERNSVGAQAPAKGSDSSLSYLIAANKGQLAESGVVRKTEPQKEAENSKPEQPSGKSVPDHPTPQETAPEVNPADPAASMPAKAAKDKWAAGAFGSSKALGSGNGLAGGSGLAGGILRSFEKEPGLGKPKDFRRNLKATTLQARVLRSADNLRGPLSQLRFASRESLRGRGASSAETRSFHATRAFEATPAQAGNNVIGAQGLSQGGEDVGVLGGGDGGPINSVTPVENAPPVKKEKDQTPYNNLIAMGVALLMTASTIILIEGILAALGKIIPPLTGIALMLMGVAAALAAAAAGMGAMVANTYGQEQQGLVLTLGGSITSAAAVAAMVAPPQVMPIVSVIGGVAGIVSAVISLLMGKRV